MSLENLHFLHDLRYICALTRASHPLHCMRPRRNASSSVSPRKAVICAKSPRAKSDAPATMNGKAARQRTSEYFGINTFGVRQMRDKLPRETLREARRRRSSRKEARPRRRAARRAGDQGMGDRARRDALHALVPAADRTDRREARRVLVVRRRAADGSVRRIAAHSERARRLELPVGRICARRGKRAATRRGIRRARCSSPSGRA